jgi:hypothetical protein
VSFWKKLHSLILGLTNPEILIRLHYAALWRVTKGDTMSGYTKLYNSIIHSTIWREDKDTRLLWITMLSLSDQHGVIEASLPGLADAARLTMLETTKALTKLSSPDEYSRDKDFKGRRIEEIEGGWIVLNYLKYRNKIDEERKRDLNRIRQARWRERNADNANHGRNAKSDAIADPDPDPDPDPDLIPPLISYSDHDLNHIHMPEQLTYDAPARAEAPLDPLPGLAVRIFDQDQDKKKTKRIDTSEDFEVFWEAYPEKKAKRKAWRAWMAAKPRLPDLPTILSAIDKQRLSGPWMAGYVPYPATWINGDRWLDENTAEKKQKLDPDEEWLNRKQIM